MHIGKRIRKIRKDNKLTQVEFARRIGISPNHLSTLESCKARPSRMVVLSIQNVFGIRKEWLLRGKGPKNDVWDLDEALDLLAELEKEDRDKFEEAIIKSKMFDALRELGRIDFMPRPRFAEERAQYGVPLPVLKVVSRRELGKLERWSPYVAVPLLAEEVAAGMPRVIEEESIDDYCLIYESWARRPQDYICVRVKGDSMEPVLPDGSIVAVHLKSRDPARLIGKVVAVRHGGGVAVKELLRSGEDWFLMSYNKEYSPLLIRPEEEESPIIGKVAWWWARQE